MTVLRLVLSSAARLNPEGKQSAIFTANEAGDDDLLRDRVLAHVMRFGIGHSAGISLETAGAGVQELDAARSGNGYGANPIGFSDLAAWASLTGPAGRAGSRRTQGNERRKGHAALR